MGDTPNRVALDRIDWLSVFPILRLVGALRMALEFRKLLMSFHSIVVQTPHGNLLVDTCIGNDKERPLMDMFHQQSFPYIERLAKVGLAPVDIDFVCCTHLHGDHVGWNTRLDNGRWIPTFPNARYLFAASELEYWEQHHAEDPASIYRRPWEDSVLPVLAAGQVQRVADDAELLDGVRPHPAPGHTPGNVVIGKQPQGGKVYNGTGYRSRPGSSSASGGSSYTGGRRAQPRSGGAGPSYSTGGRSGGASASSGTRSGGRQATPRRAVRRPSGGR